MRAAGTASKALKAAHVSATVTMREPSRPSTPTTRLAAGYNKTAVAVDNATAAFYRGGAVGFTTNLANGLSHLQSAAFPLPAAINVVKLWRAN